MAVINLERVESVMKFSPAVSIKEVLDIDELQNPTYDGKKYAVFVTSYINGVYYSIIRAEYYHNLGVAREVLHCIIESWKDDEERLITTNL